MLYSYIIQLYFLKYCLLIIENSLEIYIKLLNTYFISVTYLLILNQFGFMN